MRKNVKSLRNRLVAMLLIIGLMTIVFPVRNTTASEMATYSYVNSDDEFTLSVSDSNGNVIEVGDSVKVGTEITIRIIAPEYYETNVGDCITVEYGDYYDWEYIYLDEEHAAKYTVKNGDFRIYYYPNYWFDLNINGDKNVKSITVKSADGETTKKFSGNKAQIKIAKSTGFADTGLVDILYEFATGFDLFETVTTSGSGYANYINTDKSIRYSLYTNYDYETDIRNNRIDISVSSKKSKGTDQIVNMGKLTSAKGTYKNGKITIKGKKSIVSFMVYNVESEYGSYEYIDFSYEINKTNAKKIELIDLSKCTKLSQSIVKDLVYDLVREYRKGNFPNLKAICLPKGKIVSTTEYSDGYMEYYPLIIYNAS